MEELPSIRVIEVYPFQRHMLSSNRQRRELREHLCSFLVHCPKGLCWISEQCEMRCRVRFGFVGRPHIGGYLAQIQDVRMRHDFCVTILI